jgi:hypothetical protein
LHLSHQPHVNVEQPDSPTHTTSKASRRGSKLGGGAPSSLAVNVHKHTCYKSDFDKEGYSVSVAFLQRDFDSGSNLHFGYNLILLIYTAGHTCDCYTQIGSILAYN